MFCRNKKCWGYIHFNHQHSYYEEKKTGEEYNCSVETRNVEVPSTLHINVHIRWWREHGLNFSKVHTWSSYASWGRMRGEITPKFIVWWKKKDKQNSQHKENNFIIYKEHEWSRLKAFVYIPAAWPGFRHFRGMPKCLLTFIYRDHMKYKTLHMLGSTKWEHWSLTITKGVQCLEVYHAW